MKLLEFKMIVPIPLIIIVGVTHGDSIILWE